MDKEHQKISLNRGFPPFVTPQDFVSKMFTFVPLWWPNFGQKFEKDSLRDISRRTHTRKNTQTHGQGPLLRTPSGKSGVQSDSTYPNIEY